MGKVISVVEYWNEEGYTWSVDEVTGHIKVSKIRRKNIEGR